MIGSRAGAPPVSLPLGYLVTAAAAFLLAALALPWLAAELAGHYYHPRVIALTHTVGLGWITLTIMGASYQLLPVVLERPLWSVRLARWQFVAVTAGLAGMVSHFWLGRWAGLAWAAALVALGVAAHVANVALSLRGLSRVTFTARCFLLALAAVGLTAVLGLLLAANRLWGILPGPVFGPLAAHFHLALLGWITPMILGVAARIYPMFLLAPETAGGAAATQLWGLGLGVPGVALGLLGVPGLLVPGALGVTAALLAHAALVAGVVRDRRRPALDWGLRFVLTGTALLLPGIGVGLALALDLVAGPRWALAYAALALGGWVSLTIVGMALKIVPFLVWYRAYGSRVGREPVPTVAQLAWPGGEAAAYAGLVGGVIGLAAALAVGSIPGIALAGALLAGGAVVFMAVLVRVLRHLAAAPPGSPGPPAERTVPVEATAR